MTKLIKRDILVIKSNFRNNTLNQTFVIFRVSLDLNFHFFLKKKSNNSFNLVGYNYFF